MHYFLFYLDSLSSCIFFSSFSLQCMTCHDTTLVLGSSKIVHVVSVLFTHFREMSWTSSRLNSIALAFTSEETRTIQRGTYAKVQSCLNIFCNIFSFIQYYHPAITHCKILAFGTLQLLYDWSKDFVVLFYLRNSADKLCHCEIANSTSTRISGVIGHLHRGLTKYNISPLSQGSLYICKGVKVLCSLASHC